MSRFARGTVKWVGPAVGARVFTAMACAALVFIAQQAPASMITYGFDGIIDKVSNVGDITIGKQQLSVQITDEGSNQVKFKFFNTGTDQSTIAEIYFDDDAPFLDYTKFVDPDHFDYSDKDSQTGIHFTKGSSPPDLPRGGQDFESVFSADAGNNAPQFGVNAAEPGEWVSLLFTLKGKSYDELKEGISKGDFRMGLHVVNYASGGSESFVNGPPQVPEPSSMILLGLTAIGMGGYARCRKRFQKSDPA